MLLRTLDLRSGPLGKAVAMVVAVFLAPLRFVGLRLRELLLGSGAGGRVLARRMLTRRLRPARGRERHDHERDGDDGEDDPGDHG